MSTESSISVVIPVYNGEGYLGEAIQSALDQTRSPSEIIVIDDGSEDGSATVAGGFTSPVRCISQANAGLGATRNRGVEEASGEYIAFLDADDLWVADKLESQLAAFEKDPSLDMVFGHVEQFLSPDMPSEEQARMVVDSAPQAGYIAGAMLIRRSSFDRAGAFDTKFRVGEFVDWYARATEAGLKGTLIPQVVMRRRIHGDNMGITQKSSRSDYVRIVKAALDRRRANEKSEA